jgi:hypothetical protein
MDESYRNKDSGKTKLDQPSKPLGSDMFQEDKAGSETILAGSREANFVAQKRKIVILLIFSLVPF